MTSKEKEYVECLPGAVCEKETYEKLVKLLNEDPNFREFFKDMGGYIRKQKGLDK